MRLRLLSLLAALSVAAAAPAVSRAAEAADGPRNLLITYRAESAAKRPAFRNYLAHEEWKRLDALRRQGVIRSFQILFNPFETQDTWDAMVVLRFKAFADTAKWIDIERTQPGGLDAAGLALAHPTDTYSADSDWEGGEDEDKADAGAMFYVIPYEYQNEGEYRTYVDGYVIPQVRGWMREGVLTGYHIYMNRYPVGRPWDVLFVYRYRDLEAFGKRQATVAKVRAGLASDPAWTRWSQNKQGIRTESENVIAQSIEGQ
jgi:hypothetical protein